MKVKSHKEIIDGHNCVTFFIEDVNTNTLIHSDTFIVTRKTRIKELKYNFVQYVQDLQKMELEMVKAQSFKLTENKKVIEIN
jgi:hypothetical protein